MWFVINIGARGEENTLLTTRYKNIAQACAIFLPGHNVCRFMADNWNNNSNENFIADKKEEVA